MAPDGTAVAAMQDSTRAVSALFRPAGGAFGAIEALPGTTSDAGFVNVRTVPAGIDDDGDAVAAWAAGGGTAAVALRDGAPPQLRALSVPDAPVVGAAQTFSVTPVDVVSGVASTTWDFGDGSTPAGGANAQHAFAAPGTYTVTVTATDALGQARSAQRTVTVAAAPAAPAPVPAAVTPLTPAPAPPKLSAASAIKLSTPTKTCSSRRTLTLHLIAPKGATITKAAVTLAGKTTTYKGKKLKAKIDLRGLPKGKFSIKVKITLADGRTTSLTKSYKTCVKTSKSKTKSKG